MGSLVRQVPGWLIPAEVSEQAMARLLATFANPNSDLFSRQLALCGAWGAGFTKPHQQMPYERWIEMFRSVGFFSLGGFPPPTEPVRLYRGAADGFEPGMSWTTSPALARFLGFPLWTPSSAERRAGHSPGALLRREWR